MSDAGKRPVGQDYDDAIHKALSIAVSTLSEIMKLPYPKCVVTAENGLDQINRIFHQYYQEQKKA